MNTPRQGLEGPFSPQPAFTDPANATAGYPAIPLGELQLPLTEEEALSVPAPVEAAKQARSLMGLRDVAQTTLERTYAQNTEQLAELMGGETAVRLDAARAVRFARRTVSDLETQAAHMQGLAAPFYTLLGRAALLPGLRDSQA